MNWANSLYLSSQLAEMGLVFYEYGAWSLLLRTLYGVDIVLDCKIRSTSIKSTGRSLGLTRPGSVSRAGKGREGSSSRDRVQRTE